MICNILLNSEPLHALDEVFEEKGPERGKVQGEAAVQQGQAGPSSDGKSDMLPLPSNLYLEVVMIVATSTGSYHS